jgi:thiol:disulfide interchange protein
MKTDMRHVRFILGLLVALLAATVGIQAGDTPAAAKPAIYDESADGSKQIAEALARAGKDGKRVLLQFGANWCPWCHKLHSLFETDQGIAAQLKSGYVVVLIDVNKGRNSEVDAKYGHPIRLGLPVIVILDADGKQLTTKDSGELEEGDHHSPKKVMAFLKKWSPQT